MAHDPLSLLESRITEAESLLRILRRENEELRAALASSRTPAPAQEGAAGAEPRPVRLVVLEAERQAVRSRLQRLIEAL
jgi:hypothetical protein